VNFPDMKFDDPAEHMRFQLDQLRKDAREKIGREATRQKSRASRDGRFGSSAMYSAIEAKTSAIFAATLGEAARLLASLPGGATTKTRSRHSIPGS
jgi:hypothetical protein